MLRSAVIYGLALSTSLRFHRRATHTLQLFASECILSKRCCLSLFIILSISGRFHTSHFFFAAERMDPHREKRIACVLRERYRCLHDLRSARDVITCYINKIPGYISCTWQPITKRLLKPLYPYLMTCPTVTSTSIFDYFQISKLFQGIRVRQCASPVYFAPVLLLRVLIAGLDWIIRESS
jgi:hypothetical protein